MGDNEENIGIENVFMALLHMTRVIHSANRHGQFHNLYADTTNAKDFLMAYIRICCFSELSSVCSPQGHHIVSISGFSVSNNEEQWKTLE